MGKSPGKWIKSVLFGKKSSRSSLSKERENSVKRPANADETLTSAKLQASNITVVPPLTSCSLTGDCAGNEEHLNSGQGTVTELSDDGAALSYAKNDEVAPMDTDLGSPNDPEKLRHEHAITKVQAVCRGYLARRAFGALRGIIRLQALVRGHLVRRQAVSTLYCVLSIVKFQALVRGLKVRLSGIVSVVHKEHILMNTLRDKTSNSSKTFASSRADKLSGNSFVKKLIASSPNSMPLRLQYSTGDPNSAWEWLEHWTRSHIWEPKTQHKPLLKPTSLVKPDSHKTKAADKVKLKNGSAHTYSESEKVKRNFRKSSSYSTESNTEHPQNEIIKVKRNLKKISTTTTINASAPLLDTTPKRTQRKASVFVSEGIVDATVNSNGNSSITEAKHVDPVSENKIEDFEITETKPINVEEAEKVDQSQENGKNEDILSIANGCKDDQISDENQKMSRKITSLPSKQEDQENGLRNSPRVPSYMAATQSAKAKLRLQGSPNFGEGSAEKNGFSRRHSLPSSINGKMVSLSPRVQKLVQAKGIRVDKSLSTSRDGTTDKVMQPGWKR